MNIHNRKNLKPWLVPATLLVILAGVFLVPTVVAKVTGNTIDPVGIVADQGRKVTVTGPIAVTTGERTELRVTVTQRSHRRSGRGNHLLHRHRPDQQVGGHGSSRGPGNIRSRTGHSSRTGAQFHQRPRHRRAPVAGERHTAPRIES